MDYINFKINLHTKADAIRIIQYKKYWWQNMNMWKLPQFKVGHQ